MILRRIEVEAWRGLGHVVVDGLADGLNLLGGPNESGKSSLVEALRYGLFERSRGKKKAAIQRWGSREAPQVRLDFETPAGAWRVHKQFVERPFTVLVGAEGSWRDEEAEARLRELLRCPSDRQDDPGRWALLFVHQGQSRRLPQEDLGPDARGALQDQLAGLAGAVAGGGGEAVLTRAQAELRRYYGLHGRPVAELRDAQARVEAAERAEAVAARALDEVRGWADQLASTREALLAGTPTLAAREAADRKAGEEAELARRAGQAVALARARREAARHAEEGARERVSRAVALDALLRQQEAELAAATTAVTAAREAAATALRAEAEAEEKAALAGAALARAESELERARGEAERARWRQRREELAARLLRVDEAEAQRDAARARAVGVADAALRALREALAARDLAGARMEAAAVRLRVRALRPLRVDGAPLPAGAEAELVVTGPRSVELGEAEAWARLEVVPGGEELPGLRAALERSEAAARAATAAVGGLDLAGAEASAAARRAAEARVAEEEGALAGLLAGATRETLARELRGLEEKLGPEAPTAAPSIGPLFARVELPIARPEPEVEAELAARRAAAAGARQALQQAQARAKAAELARVAAEATERAATEKIELSRGQRRGLGPSPPGETDPLTAALVEAQALSRAAIEALDRAEADCALVGGAEAEERARRARQELEQARAERARLEEAARVLAARVEVAVGAGPYELLLAARAGLAEAREARLRVERRAAAAKRLVEVLEESRRSTQADLVQPVLARAEPWVARLFAGARPRLGREDWRLTGLNASQDEAFDDLSGGAQEQLSLVVRVAFAEVLAGAERLPLVLDDSLIHTDAARRLAFTGILAEAAARLQVLLFTCHPESFPGHEARNFPLRSLRG